MGAEEDIEAASAAKGTAADSAAYSSKFGLEEEVAVAEETGIDEEAQTAAAVPADRYRSRSRRPHPIQRNRPVRLFPIGRREGDRTLAPRSNLQEGTFQGEDEREERRLEGRR